MGRILHAFVHFCSMPHLSIMPWRYLVDCVYGRVAYKKIIAQNILRYCITISLYTRYQRISSVCIELMKDDLCISYSLFNAVCISA